MERKILELYIVDFTKHTCRKGKLALFIKGCLEGLPNPASAKQSFT